MKLLLVGELNETLNSLNEYLMGEFQVQMCSENAKNVKDMVRLLRPSVIVMNIVELGSEVTGIFSMLSDKLNTMPLVVIGTSQMSSDLSQRLVGFKNTVILERPINTNEVLKACKSALKLEVEDETTNEPAALEKKTILVTDDNALMLRHMKQLLGDEYQVLLANSGEKALEILKNGDIDLLLLDYDMPGIDGREVFERIIADEKTKDLPVIFLTSVSEKNQILEVLVNKPFGYILKPPSNERIKSAIKEAFNEA